MSNELYDAIGKFDDLVSQKESQELILMKLKCEIREQKNIVKRLKREHDREHDREKEEKKQDEINVDEPIEQIVEKPVKVKKNKAPKKAIKE
jgi:hypothetical protein